MSDEEDQPMPQMDIDMDFGQFTMDAPPAPEPSLFQQQQQHPKLMRPTISTEAILGRNSLDGPAQLHVPSPVVHDQVMQLPLSYVSV
jgi:hypothetical protein